MARSTAQRLASHQRRYRELAAQLADVGYIAAGSITHRHTRCANQNCRCHADPPQMLAEELLLTMCSPRTWTPNGHLRRPPG